MAISPSPEVPPPSTQPVSPRVRPPPHPESRSWLVERLDSLLSKPLREAPPAELVRHRILAGSAITMFVVDLLYVLWSLALNLS
ncbi:MAG: nitrogen regulation protein NtrB, partial [Myxococcaceae bacterium]|nr:nitrogen regulation protein NtrB [Myxococcaceae bacterium]